MLNFLKALFKTNEYKAWQEFGEWVKHLDFVGKDNEGNYVYVWNTRELGKLKVIVNFNLGVVRVDYGGIGVDTWSYCDKRDKWYPMNRGAEKIPPWKW